MAETPATRLLNGIAAALPPPLWRQTATLAAIARVAGHALGAGRLQLSGCTLNGQRFRANPRRLWLIKESRARIDRVDLGVPGPLTPQAQLGDFLIPRRGLFVIGSAFFQHAGEGCRVASGSALRPARRGCPVASSETVSG